MSLPLSCVRLSDSVMSRRLLASVAIFFIIRAAFFVEKWRRTEWVVIPPIFVSFWFRSD